MLRICIKPTTFQITEQQDKQNVYIDVHHVVNKKKANKQHDALERAFHQLIPFIVKPTNEILPDIVFVANGGLSLPRLPEPVVILPNMKYPQRKRELKYLKDIFKQIDIKCVPFLGGAEAPFEGAAELKWFDGGKKAVCAYGFRSTRKTFEIMEELLKKIYDSYGVTPPELLVIPLDSADYYHLDVAMLELEGEECIVHRKAFSHESIKKLQAFLHKVHVLDTKDSFCLNAVVDGKNLITHKLDPALKDKLEKITGKHVKQVDTSEFEKSGGSVRCMTLDIYL